MMDERSVIDIQRDLADPGQNVLAILVIKNPYIFCDKTAKRVQRQAADVGFDSALAQFLHYPVAPLTAKSSFGEVIPSAANRKNYDKNHEAHEGHGDSTCPGSFSTLSRRPNLRWFEDGRHGVGNR
jgi:hypothetical protein